MPENWTGAQRVEIPNLAVQEIRIGDEVGSRLQDQEHRLPECSRARFQIAHLIDDAVLIARSSDSRLGDADQFDIRHRGDRRDESVDVGRVPGHIQQPLEGAAPFQFAQRRHAELQQLGVLRESGDDGDGRSRHGALMPSSGEKGAHAGQHEGDLSRVARIGKRAEQIERRQLRSVRCEIGAIASPRRGAAWQAGAAARWR